MTDRDRQLVFALRAVQWEIDDVAQDIPSGRCSDKRLSDLADALEHLAGILRSSSVETTTIDPTLVSDDSCPERPVVSNFAIQDKEA